MDNELIYQVGEAILLEIDEVNEVLYSKLENNSGILDLWMKNGLVYNLILKK